MLRYLLERSEIATLLRFVSPRALDVCRPTDILAVAARLRANRGDTAQWQGIRSQFEHSLDRAQLRIRLSDQDARAARSGSSSAGSITERHAVGQETLALFFHQIFAHETWILDLGSKAFGQTPDHPQLPGARVEWRPKPHYFALEPRFVASVRELYGGFYEDQPDRFEGALDALELKSANAELRRHFGAGDQREVRFELAQFQRSFADVFAACARSRSRLNPGFLVLGILLLSLYEHLETVGGAYDVRAAYERGVRRASDLHARAPA